MDMEGRGKPGVRGGETDHWDQSPDCRTVMIRESAYHEYFRQSQHKVNEQKIAQGWGEQKESAL
jgi:hypothetical protein